jgi:hypothetical protein
VSVLSLTSAVPLACCTAVLNRRLLTLNPIPHTFPAPALVSSLLWQHYSSEHCFLIRILDASRSIFKGGTAGFQA